MRASLVLSAPFLMLSVSLLGACGRGESAQERQMAQLRDELSHVQADHDRFEQRLSALEIHNADDRALQSSVTSSPSTPSSTAPTPQNLRVVRLSPDGSEQVQASSETAGASEDPDDTSPRPSIKVQGARAQTDRKGVRAFRGTGDRIEETLPPSDDPQPRAAGPALVQPSASSASSRPSALDPEAKRAYDAALALVNAHKYAQDLEVFAGFLIKWPDHPNADNAMYWRGECYFAQGEFARAAEQFEGVLARFPYGNKVPDSLLKLGISQQKLGNPQIAQQHFDRLLRDFPRSEAARRVRDVAGAPQDSRARARESEEKK